MFVKSFYEKLKNKISLKEMLTVKNLFLPGTNKLIKGQIYSSKFLNSIKLEELEKFLKLKNHREKMSVRVNVYMSKIMRALIKVGVHMCVMYSSCRSLRGRCFITSTSPAPCLFLLDWLKLNLILLLD